MEPQDLQWLETPEPGWSPVELAFLTLKDTFVSGDNSGHRLSVRYYRRDADGALIGKVFFGPGTQGPPGHAHGGSMAALLDESMGGAAWLAGHPVVAAQLDIKFSSMLPLKTRCLVENSVLNVEGRKVRTCGTLTDISGREKYCEGEGLFIILSEENIERLSARAQVMIDRVERKISDSLHKTDNE